MDIEKLSSIEEQINAILVQYGINHHYKCYDLSMSETFLESISGDKVRTIWADKFQNIRVSYHPWYNPPLENSTVE